LLPGWRLDRRLSLRPALLALSLLAGWLMERY
jgi:hypothetical protein